MVWITSRSNKIVNNDKIFYNNLRMHKSMCVLTLINIVFQSFYPSFCRVYKHQNLFTTSPFNGLTPGRENSVEIGCWTIHVLLLSHYHSPVLLLKYTYKQPWSVSTLLQSEHYSEPLWFDVTMFSLILKSKKYPTKLLIVCFEKLLKIKLFSVQILYGVGSDSNVLQCKSHDMWSYLLINDYSEGLANQGTWVQEVPLCWKM